MSIFKLGLIGKTPPGKFKDIVDHLTRAKKKKSDFPDVFFANELPIPVKKQNVEEIEAINRFTRDNPRKDMANGGRIGLRGGDAARSDAASGRNAGRADPSGGVERGGGNRERRISEQYIKPPTVGGGGGYQKPPVVVNPLKNLQTHFDNNQKLKDAVTLGLITNEEYNTLGGYDVKETLGMGPVDSFLGSLAYNTVQSIKGDQPFGEIFGDAKRTAQGATNISPELKAKYENIMQMADGGRIGFKKGERVDLELENLTRIENAKEKGVKTRDASAFKALPGYDNITYTDFRNKETGEVFRKYGVRVRVQDKNVQKIGTTADKYKNIDTLKEALELRDDFRKANPKNIKPLDKEKQKIVKDTRRTNIKGQGGVEDFLPAKAGTGVQKGHAGNIKKQKIKPSNIIYTPEAINVGMAGRGDAKVFTDLDYKIEQAEEEIERIKKSKAPLSVKKRLLDAQDKLLTDYAFQSGGFKTPTLSTGEVFGEFLQKGKSMDMFDIFPNMTEKEAKTFVRKYITEKGELKPFYKRKVEAGTLSDADKINIQKSKLFLDNVELAKKNVKTFNVKKFNKEQSNILKMMGFKCKFAKADGGRIGLSTGSGRCDDPASYVDDINETRKNLNSDDVRVRAAAKAKLDKGLQIAKTLPKIGTFLRRAGQATLGSISKALQASGLGTPVGLAVEGIVEGGIYDYYRGKGYTHDQAYQETFFPGIISGRPEGVPWYGGAESLLEKELVGATGVDEEGKTIATPENISGKVAQYVSALKDQDQVYDAFGRLEQGQQAQRKDIIEEAQADIQDLNRSGTINRINKLMNVDTRFDADTAKQAYEEAVQAQAAKQAARGKAYKDEYYVNQDTTQDFDDKLQKERNKDMLQMFPPTTVEQVQNAYKAAGRGDELKNFQAQDYKNIMQAADIFNKQSYFADNFRLEKAGGGIAKLAGVSSGPPPASGPNSQGLLSLKNRARNY